MVISVLRDLMAWFVTMLPTLEPAGVPNRLFEHVWYSVAATVLAVLTGVPLGALVGHTRKGELLVVSLANGARALPTFGLVILVFLLFGLGFLPVLVALVVLAVPGVLTSTYAGVAEVEPGVVDAARGIGMTGMQVLTQVELPAATPLIMAGIRTAAVQVIATATLAAYIGLGGLGRYLVDGLATQDLAEVVGGAIVVAVLAIGAELLLGALTALLVPRGLRLLAKTNSDISD